MGEGVSSEDIINGLRHVSDDHIIIIDRIAELENQLSASVQSALDFSAELDACRQELAEARKDTERLLKLHHEKCALLGRGAVDCNHLHHEPHQYHASHEPCPVVDRIKAIDNAMKGQHDE
jgi:hypothetical protein